MTKVSEKQFQHSYQKLYAFLRSKHPEVLQEYKAYLEEVKKRVEDALLNVSFGE